MDRYTTLFKEDIHKAGEALSGLAKFGIIDDVNIRNGKVSIKINDSIFDELYVGGKRRDKGYASFDEMYVEFENFEVSCLVRKNEEAE